VIVAKFDGDGLADPSPDDEPLRYQKYTLPEEPLETTEVARRNVPAPTAAEGPQDGASETAAAASSDVPAPLPIYEEEERIEIPGTHVPGWVVGLLIVGVVALLGATAILLLR
jgi:hypothetical protein